MSDMSAIVTIGKRRMFVKRHRAFETVLSETPRKLTLIQ
jgi:hypothetical protein